MALNLVEYKSPVQNVIAYARIACLLFTNVCGYIRECFLSHGQNKILLSDLHEYLCLGMRTQR